MGRNTNRENEIVANPTHKGIDKLLKLVNTMTEEFRDTAFKTKVQIRECEAFRTRIINLIEEAEYHGLDKRTASRLEDKLHRTYAILLTK